MLRCLIGGLIAGSLACSGSPGRAPSTGTPAPPSEAGQVAVDARASAAGGADGSREILAVVGPDVLACIADEALAGRTPRAVAVAARVSGSGRLAGLRVDAADTVRTCLARYARRWRFSPAAAGSSAWLDLRP